MSSLLASLRGPPDHDAEILPATILRGILQKELFSDSRNSGIVPRYEYRNAHETEMTQTLRA